MRKRIKRFISNITGIDEAEIKKALLFQAILFLLITVLLLLKPTVSSVFISSLGTDALPLAYMITALVAVAGSRFYDIFMDRYNLKYVISGSLVLVAAILIFMVVWLILNGATPFILYALYIFVALYGLLSTSQFWLLANTSYNIREAKKCYGLIGVGGIAGGIFGGYLTSLLTTIMPAEYVLFVAAFLVLTCLLLYRKLWSLDQNILVPQKKEMSWKGIAPLTIIKGNKLLLYTTLITAASVFAAKLIDYQYSDFALHYADNKEKLSAFFGVWLSNISIISLLIQLFLTKKVLKNIGVANSLLIMPTGILVGSILLLVLPELWVVVGIKLIDGTLKQSINKSAKELIIMPIPIAMKEKTKSFIDVVVDSLATGLAGGTLYILVKNNNVPVVYISFFTVIVMLVWLILVFKIKKVYGNAFAELAGITLTHTTKRSRRNKTNRLPVDHDDMIELIDHGSEEQLLTVLKRVEEYKDPQFFSYVPQLLEHSSPKVRRMAIKIAALDNQSNYTDQMVGMVQDNDQLTATEAFGYLIGRTKPFERENFYEQYLKNVDDPIFPTALIGLSFELGKNKRLHAKYHLDQYVQNGMGRWQTMPDGDPRKKMLIALLRSIGNSALEPYYKLLQDRLQASDIEIVKIAMNSAAQTGDPQFIPLLAQHLANTALRTTAEEGIISYGKRIIEPLTQGVLNGKIDGSNAFFVPQLFSRLPKANALSGLLLLAEKAPFAIRIQALQVLIALKGDSPKIVPDYYVVNLAESALQYYRENIAVIHSLTIINSQTDLQTATSQESHEARKGLVTLLLQLKNRPKTFVAYLLQLKYPAWQIESARKVFLEHQKDDVSYALEYLDNLLDMSLRKSIMPLLETELLPSDNGLAKEFKYLKCKVLNEATVFTLLLQRKDTRIVHAVLHCISAEKDPKYGPLIQPLLNSNHDSVRKHAKQVVQELQAL